MASVREPLKPTPERPHRCEFCGLCRAKEEMYTLAKADDKYSHSQCHDCAKRFARQDQRTKVIPRALDVSHPAYMTRTPRKARGQRAAPHLPRPDAEEYRTYNEE
jgi:hypothetical protein